MDQADVHTGGAATSQDMVSVVEDNEAVFQ